MPGLFFFVFLGVGFATMGGVLSCIVSMRGNGLGIESDFFVVAGLLVLCGFGVVLGGFGMMHGGVLVALVCFLQHDLVI